MYDGLLDIIIKLNPWYDQKTLPDHLLEGFKRREFKQLYKSLQRTSFTTLLVGGRRVGKSVLIYQLINELFQDGVNPQKIIFIQGDNPVLQEYNNQGLLIDAILRAYDKLSLLNTDKTFPIYVFIDEAQAIKNWAGQIKSLTDLSSKWKFFLTGSSSKQLRRGGHEALTGRVDIFTLPTMSFSDFYRLNLPLEQRLSYQQKMSALQDDFINALKQPDKRQLIQTIQSIDVQIPKDADKIFEKYLLCGGYPWVAQYQLKQFNDPTHLSEMALKYLRDLMIVTIYRDILDVNIDNPQSLGRILTQLAHCIGSSVSQKDIAKKLNLDERTVNKYIDYLVDSHLVYFCQKKSSGINKISSGNQKVYLSDNALVNHFNFILNLENIEKDRHYRGRLIENCLYTLLLNFQTTTASLLPEERVKFYQDPQSRKEVDYIYKIENNHIALEIKSKTNITNEDIEALENLLKTDKQCKYGFLVADNLSQLPSLNQAIYLKNYVLASLL